MKLPRDGLPLAENGRLSQAMLSTRRVSDARDSDPEALGRHRDRPGRHPDASGKHPDESGKYPDASWKHPDASGKYPDVSWKHPDAPGKHPDAPGKPPGLSGKHPEVSGRHVAASRAVAIARPVASCRTRRRAGTKCGPGRPRSGGISGQASFPPRVRHCRQWRLRHE